MFSEPSGFNVLNLQVKNFFLLISSATKSRFSKSDFVIIISCASPFSSNYVRSKVPLAIPSELVDFV